jgi:hypothetical protein
LRYADTEAALLGAWSGLERQWQESRSRWRDAVAADFERRYWDHIRQRIGVLLRAAKAFDGVLERALRDTL